MLRKLATARASYTSSSEQQRPLAWPPSPASSPSNCGRRRWFQSCMVSPTTSGDATEAFVELFSASRAAAVELSTPPLMAMAMDISELSAVSFQLSAFADCRVLIADGFFPIMRRHGAELFH